jgi:hypothetical protein
MLEPKIKPGHLGPVKSFSYSKDELDLIQAFLESVHPVEWNLFRDSASGNVVVDDEAYENVMRYFEASLKDKKYVYGSVEFATAMMSLRGRFYSEK